MSTPIGRRSLRAASIVALLGMIAAVLIGFLGHSTAYADVSTIKCTDVAKGKQSTTCSVKGTTMSPTVTLPMTVPAGVAAVPVGTFPMTSGAGTMTIVKNADGTYSVTFAFSKAYLANHTGPFWYSGDIGLYIDTYQYPGPWKITVGGKSTEVTNPGDYCDTTCQNQPELGIKKAGWYMTDKGLVATNIILGANRVTPNQIVTWKDAVGPGQTGCTARVLSVLNGTDTVIAEPKFVGNSVSYTHTLPATIPAGTWYALNVTCSIVKGAQGPFTDTGSVAGMSVKATVPLPTTLADGGGTQPSASPTPTPSKPPLPATGN